MEQHLKEIFHGHVAYQCRYALIAAAQLDEAVRDEEANDRFAGTDNYDWDEMRRCNDRIWAAIQGLLTAVANVSKLLWGQKGNAPREDLRSALSVDSSSPLRDRAVRNKLEHLDEYLDAWWAEAASRKVYIDNVIGPLDRGDIVSGVAVSNESVFRRFDPTTGEVLFWDWRVNLVDLVREVQRILPMAESGRRP